MGRIILGILLLIGGAATTIRSEDVFQALGTITWAEEHMSSMSGSRMFYKLLGVGMSLVGILIATNLLNDFLNFTVGALLIPNQQ